MHNKKHLKLYRIGKPYQLVLPVNLEGLVPAEDDSVRLLSHELEDWITACCIRFTLPKTEVRYKVYHEYWLIFDCRFLRLGLHSGCF